MPHCVVITFCDRYNLISINNHNHLKASFNSYLVVSSSSSLINLEESSRKSRDKKNSFIKLFLIVGANLQIPVLHRLPVQAAWRPALSWFSLFLVWILILRTKRNILVSISENVIMNVL